MNLRANISKEDIKKVNDIRHHSPYETGFERTQFQGEDLEELFDFTSPSEQQEKKEDGT